MRHVLLCGLLAAASVSASFTGQGSASTAIPGHEFSATAHDRQGVIDVEGRLLLPGGSARVRGIITVLQWGAGTLVYDDPAWHRLAEDLSFGLLRLAVTNHGGPPDPLDLPAEQQAVRNASLGGAEALLTLLTDLARETRHPEVQDAKLIFWGHSAAGSFATGFTALHPTRVIAFVRYHSHSRGLPVDLGTNDQVPAIIFAGEKDTTAGVEDSEALWRSGRRLNAPWTFALEPGATHGSPEALKKANLLAFPWIRAVVARRLSKTAELRRVNYNSGWLAGMSGAEIKQAQSFRGPKSEAIWLPDERSAKGWRAVTTHLPH